MQSALLNSRNICQMYKNITEKHLLIKAQQMDAIFWQFKTVSTPVQILLH